MRPLRVRSAGALLAASTLLVAGCGGDGVDLSTAAATALDGQVVQIRRAVAGGDRVAAQAEVAELRGLADRLHRQGEIGDGRAERIKAAAADVESQLSLLPSERGRVEPEEEPADEEDLGDQDAGDQDPGDELDPGTAERVEEARRRVEEQLREAEKKVEEANRKAGKAGRGEGD